MLRYYWMVLKDFFFRLQKFLYCQNVLIFIFLTKHPTWGKHIKLHKNFFSDKDPYLTKMQWKYRKLAYKTVGDEIFFIKCINYIFGNVFFIYIWIYIL